MKLTVLSENTSYTNLPAEHGLSLYVEVCGKRILFDTGQSGLFADNAEALGIDLSRVELCVLSHGHYDHGGGLERFLQINKTAPVYTSAHAFEPHFSSQREYNGLDADLQNDPRLVFIDETCEISEGFTLYTSHSLKNEFDDKSGGLFMQGENGLVPDDFRHELYLLITENGRRVLLSGCSHNGILNITSSFLPNILIGGFHYFKKDAAKNAELLRDSARTLLGFNCLYYTCHCTGLEQYKLLKTELGEGLHYISVGDSISF